MAREVRTRLGARLREWRRIRRLTQETLAERAGLSYKFIGEIERGRGNPTVETLAKLSQALDLDIGDLFGGPGSRLPAGTYGLSVREVEMVREAARSLEDVVNHLQSVRASRRGTRGRAS